MKTKYKTNIVSFHMQEKLMYPNNNLIYELPVQGVGVLDWQPTKGSTRGR
jgi:hypothetical protein